MPASISKGRLTLSAGTRESLRVALIAFVVGRILYSAWAALIIRLLPTPLGPDPVLRPYHGHPALLEGVAGALLGPWQRFDTMHYLSLAQDGYAVHNSVFPPLFPLLIRITATPIERLTDMSASTAGLIAGLLIANVSLIAALTLLHSLGRRVVGLPSANRAVLYLVFFPTGFYLFAAYSESLFLLLALSAFMLAIDDKPLWAGVLAALAALTRLTGWVLIFPLAYAYLQHRSFDWRRVEWRVLGLILPPLALVGFFLWRTALGLPPIQDVYEQFWFQRTGVPGRDLWTAFQTLITGSGPRAGELSLILDVLVTAILFVSTYLAFRKLDTIYGLYCASLLFFMLLPTSEVKPLYSFSRYALTFFPTFLLLGQAANRPWVHRAVLYLSLLLALFFSGQFFIWGWVA